MDIVVEFLKGEKDSVPEYSVSSTLLSMFHPSGQVDIVFEDENHIRLKGNTGIKITSIHGNEWDLFTIPSSIDPARDSSYWCV